MALQTRRNLTATPERWAKAVTRAIREGVEVRQVNATGQWVATSGSRDNVAYLVSVSRGIAHACTCEAGTWGDPVCKHRAAFYLAVGMFDPEPPAIAA